MLRIVENEYGYFDLFSGDVDSYSCNLLASSTHPSALYKWAQDQAEAIPPSDAIGEHDAAKGYTLRHQPRTITASVGA